MAMIFVAVPAYRDPRVIETVNSLLSMASGEHGLRFGICIHDNDLDTVNKLRQVPGCDVQHASYLEARGVVEARRVCWSMWQGEEWGLSIDAHTRATQDWDRKLIAQHEQTNDPYALLSTSPIHVHDSDPLPGGFAIDLNQYDPSGGGWLPMALFWDDVNFVADRPIPARRLSMALAFSRGQLFQDVQWPNWIDPHGNAEEPWWTVACWESGYSLWHPEGKTLLTARPMTTRDSGRFRRIADQVKVYAPPWRREQDREFFTSYRRRDFYRYAGIRVDGSVRPHDEWLNYIGWSRDGQ